MKRQANDSDFARLSGAGGRSVCVELSQLTGEPVHRPQQTDGVLWLPRPLPPGRAVHLASSRLGRQLESFPTWFDALRTFAGSIDPDTTFLLTADGTTADPFIRRISWLYDIPVVRLAPLPKKLSTSWIADQIANESEIQTVWVGTESTSKKLNWDSLLIGMAQEVRVLRVTSGGNVHRNVLARLEHGIGQTLLLVDEQLTKPKVVEDLVVKGAAAWWLYGGPAAGQDHNSKLQDSSIGCETASAPVIGLGQIDSSQYVLHWTRRRTGPWPDQGEADFLDDLIFRGPSVNHQQRSALCRILATERLIATSRLNRANARVVCFSDVPLHQLDQHRTFRPHLSRWDFEPYGVAIRRETLRKLGAQPVIYGDEQAWEQLPAADRPFFQPAESRDGKIDWRREKEWRMRGDVPLGRIPADEAIVFVPSKKDAASVARLSRWPVVVLQNAGSS